MRYKLICTDIDGTLLDKNRALSSATIREIKRIKDRVPVILVSSRMPKAMRHLQDTLGIAHFPIIAYNGGLVLLYPDQQQQPETFLSLTIPAEIPGRILQEIRNTDIHMSLYRNDEWFVPGIDFWAAREINNTRVEPSVAALDELIQSWETHAQGPHKIMCMGPADEIHALESFLLREYSETLNIYRSKPTYLELSSKLISKASAIRKLVEEKMGYQMAEVMAFGDNYNDIEMLEAVGLGIAVANANDALKQVSDEHTLSNVDDGVAASIRKYFRNVS